MDANPLRIILTEGQRADDTQAADLVADYQTDALLADRGYDADSFINLLENNQIEVVIPAKKTALTSGLLMKISIKTLTKWSVILTN